MKTVIIYNLNSTGDSESNAKELARQLREKGIEVSTSKTTHAGHGEEIAERYAKRDEKVILISSSGDGGYHEVVNGALAHPTKHFIVGVLPSGNANDHHSALGSGSLAASIAKKKFRHIDTIKVTATVDGKPWARYAHSYVGMGVTAVAAKKLTEDRPNLITEKWIVLKSLFSFRYIKLKEHDGTRRYSSLLFGNIDRMSKVIKLSDKASVSDGKFEMSAIRFHSKLRLIGYLVTAAAVGLKDSRSLRTFECVAVRPVAMQLDGETVTIDAKSPITIESVKQNLHCVL